MRSLQNLVESEGNNLQNYIENKSKEILLNNSFLFENDNTIKTDNQLEIKLKTKKDEEICKAIPKKLTGQ